MSSLLSLNADYNMRGGMRTRHRSKNQSFSLVFANVGSLAKRYKSLLDTDVDLLAMAETRANSFDQRLIDNVIKTRDWQVCWGHPVGHDHVGDGYPMSDRSGGIALFARDHWHIEKYEFQIELEAPVEHYQWYLATRRDAEVKITILVYYGHPRAQQRTERDLSRINAAAAWTPAPLVVAADCNIDDGDPFQTPHGEELLDIALHLHRAHDKDLQHTHFGPLRHSRIDRIFAERFMALSVLGMEQRHDCNLAGHVPIAVTFGTAAWRAEEHTAAGPLVKPGHEPVPQPLALQQALETMKEVMASSELDVDQKYESWSLVWEAYLAEIFQQQLHKTKRRGCIAEPVPAVLRPAVPKLSAWHRRLANYITTLRMLATAENPSDQRWKKRWKALTSSSYVMAARYGTPTLAPDFNQDTIVKETLQQTLKYFQHIWDQEMERTSQDAMQRFKLALHANGGVNRLTASILKQKVPNRNITVKTAEGNKTEYAAVLEEVYGAWQPYFNKAPKHDISEWEQQWLSRLSSTPLRLEALTGKDLQQALRRANKRSTPGPDHWRTGELAQLPTKALEDLAQLYTWMEQRGRLHHSMLRSWTALLPKDEGPAEALALRPIALLSAAYRLYASARQASMAEWQQKMMPPEVFSYVRGRSVHDAGIRLAQIVEMQRLRARREQEERRIFVASLDASKAFPSVHRVQVWATWRRMGAPQCFLDFLESNYVSSSSRFRIGGSSARDGSIR